MAIDIIQCNQQKNIEKEISNEQKSDNIYKILTAQEIWNIYQASNGLHTYPPSLNKGQPTLNPFSSPYTSKCLPLSLDISPLIIAYYCALCIFDQIIQLKQYYLIQASYCGYFTYRRNQKTKINYHNNTNHMESSLAIFSSTAPLQMGKNLCTNKAKRLEADLTITIFEKCLMEVTSKGVKSYVPFDFDLKFTSQASPPAIIFQKGQQKQTYLLMSESDLKNWRQILKFKINQRGFHELFKPKKKIGKGNFASVYLAEKLEEGKNYAVKAFSKEAAYSEQKGKECLIKQIEIMRNLSHKNCMKLFEVYESDNSLYIVVELLEGGQLYDKIKAKYKFKPHEVKKIIVSILHGLKEMHSKKIMHRDLKPQNLIFRAENNWDCVIADFGLAQFSEQPEYLFVRCGTPGYVAPEVINIKDMKTKYDPICDIFSLGLIFHILLLGISAFPGKTYNQVLAQNRASNILFEGDQYKSLDQNALNLLAKMLKKNPKERISAESALKHPYFEDRMQEQEQDDVVPLREIKKNYPNCESPLLISANPARKLDKNIKKDSCVDFVMGKQNLYTGKVDTVTEVGSTNNSVGKRFESMISPKASKFSAKK